MDGAERSPRPTMTEYWSQIGAPRAIAAGATPALPPGRPRYFFAAGGRRASAGSSSTNSLGRPARLRSVKAS